jgi:PIN domain nuclease of toxin-antitoxin system
LNLLLDTHVALWAITDSPKLAAKARELIASPKTNVWISTASIWEIAIKHSLGRGDMPISGQDALRYFLESGYRRLPIEAEHAVAVEDLPTHHSDPFDRILVAQALVEPMRLMTHDALMALYSDTIIKI